jgi:hypothetical protein
MTVHLPPLFTILGVGFASLFVGFVVFALIGAWSIVHMDSGPEWPLRLAIPCAIIAAVVSGYFFWGLT